MALTADAPTHRFLEQYAKQYHAGAFATPTRKELEARPELITEDTRYGRDRAVVVARRLSRDSERTDFTGATFILPKGAYVATHIGRTPYLMPSTAPYDFVMAYAEDRELSLQLAAEDRMITASRITAAAEVINVWGSPGRFPQLAYPAWDRATVVDFGEVMAGFRDTVLSELEIVHGWDDDFPYYSDGSWSAVCLKGFWPDEPGRGVKPAEMPKSWKMANREALSNPCDWTVLTKQLPLLYGWVRRMSWDWQTERVRLLKMNAGGKLGRHTDITDRAGGTKDGQIVRFHIPLITDPSIKLITWDLDGQRRERHLEAWHMYYLDARKPHAVTNPSNINRIHLVVDAISSPSIRQRISEAHSAGQA